MGTEAFESVSEQGPPAGAVVVGVDGGEHDPVVLAVAVTEARTRGVPLHVRHCRELLDPFVAFAGEVIVPVTEEMDRSEEVLAAARATVEGLAADLPVTFDRPPGRAENLLVEAGDRAALLVVGAKRHSRLEELFVGSVALNAAAFATCPVLVVPPGSDPARVGPVLVGVDGSEPSRVALVDAVAAARRRGTGLLVVTTWHLEVVDGFVVTEPGSDGWQRVEGRIRTMQEGLLAEVDHAGLEVEVRQVRGARSSALAELTRGASLAVVGTRGRGGFRRKALGSVTVDLLKRATCPVLVSRGAR